MKNKETNEITIL